MIDRAIAFSSQHLTLFSPLAAEVQAILQGIRVHINDASFFSNSLIVVSMIKGEKQPIP